MYKKTKKMSKTLNSMLPVQLIKQQYIPKVPRWKYLNASSPTWRFYWNPEPGAWIESYGQRIELVPDNAVIIPPGTRFATGSRNPFAHFFIHFSLQASNIIRRIIVADASKIILPEFAKKLPFYSHEQLELAAHSVVAAALLQIPREKFLPETDGIGENTVFDKVLNLTDDSRCFAGNCIDLAQKCGVSINTLQRHFLRTTGLPVKKWLLNRKMECAVQLLMYKGRSIKETADQLGFADRYHFSKVFKQYFGMSPGKFVKSGGIPLP